MDSNKKLTAAEKMLGSCEWTKVYFDEEAVNMGHLVIVKDTQGLSYVLEQCLGHGFEGEVWKVRRLDQDQQPWGPELALKFEIGDVDIGKHLKSEYDLLVSLDHPYIIKPVKYWLSPMLGPDDTDINRGHMLTYFIRGPHIDKAQLSPEESQQAILDLIAVLRYLNQTIKIYHGDLKADNVIWTQVDQLKYPIVIDFGFPGPIEDQPYIDRKALGLIYLQLIGLSDDLVNQFKKNMSWYGNMDKLYSPGETEKAISSITRLRSQQLTILQSFFDGTSHNDLYELVKTSHWFKI